MAINHVDGDDETQEGDVLLLIFIVLLIIMIMVTIGTLGYRVFGKLAWIDSFHNGAMVFTSTSLITPVNTYNGKIFSAFYNLICGIFVLIIIGVIIRRGLIAAGISTASNGNGECNCCNNCSNKDYNNKDYNNKDYNNKDCSNKDCNNEFPTSSEDCETDSNVFDYYS